MTATDLIAQSITLPCGLVLPNRLVKCPMQETLAVPPLFDPPIDKFERLYTQWAHAKYGLIITEQVQIDIRYLSIKGDVVCHENSMKEPHLSKWKRWATISQEMGTPCIVQLAHPGRMSPAGAGNRPADMAPLCPSAVPVKLGEGWLNKRVCQNPLYKQTPKLNRQGPRCHARHTSRGNASRHRHGSCCVGDWGTTSKASRIRWLPAPRRARIPPLPISESSYQPTNGRIRWIASETARSVEASGKRDSRMLSTTVLLVGQIEFRRLYGRR